MSSIASKAVHALPPTLNKDEILLDLVIAAVYVILEKNFNTAFVMISVDMEAACSV